MRDIQKKNDTVHKTYEARTIFIARTMGIQQGRDMMRDDL
jgi:hypothetical protein